MALLKSLHLEALTPAARRVLKLLPEIPIWRDFYLAGGTALALQLGHRVSVDLDFFSEKNKLNGFSRNQLARSFSKKGPIEILEEKNGTSKFSFYGVQLSFFYYEVPLLKSPIKIEEHLRLASLFDIGLMKLGAVIGRGSKKDFLDLYTLSNRGVTLEKLLSFAPRKYPNVRDFITQALRALIYFEDADEEPMPKMLVPLDWKEVKKFFQDQILRLSREWF